MVRGPYWEVQCCNPTYHFTTKKAAEEHEKTCKAEWRRNQ